MLNTWLVALECLSIKEIEDTTIYCVRYRKIREPDKNYLPSTDEFIEIARRLTKEKKARERKESEKNEILNHKHNPIGKKRMKENVDKIIENLIKLKIHLKTSDTETLCGHIIFKKGQYQNALQIITTENEAEVTCFKCKKIISNQNLINI